VNGEAIWQKLEFGRCADLVNGRAYAQTELLASGPYQVIRIQNLNGGSSWYYSDLELDDEKYCESGDLLFAWSATFGPYFWSGKKAVFHYHIWRVVPKPEYLDKGFAYFLLLWTTAKIKAAAHGIAMLHFTKEGMESYEVALPPVSTQRRIAARLKAQFAELDAARQAAQAQADDILLLRRRVLAEVFAAVEDEPRKRLGDHAPTTSGSTPPRSVKAYWAPAEVPWVKTGEVAFDPITRTEEAISRKALAECSLTLLPPGTVLVAMYGQGKTRGQSAILEIAAATNQACFAILPNDTWDPGFLFHWLMAGYQELRELSEGRGGNQANLNGALLNALEIPAPSRVEQAAIARRAQAALSEVQALADANQAQRAELERLPQRLLAQAFNAEGD
jgi:type I restriction enzyme S subunit